MIKAVLFDLDGVLADTETTRLESLKHIAAKKGHLSKFNDLTVRDCIGLTTEVFFLNVVGLSDKVEINEIKQERYRKWRQHPEKYILPIKGTTELIQALKERGIKIAVVTNAYREQADLALATLGLTKYLDVIISIDDLSVPKPDPESYLKALEKLGLPSEECIAVEDTTHGMSSAIGAGLKVIAITTHYSREELKNADYIVDSHNEILCIIQ